jgi:hypothetical protein
VPVGVEADVGSVSVEIPLPADVRLTADGDKLGTKPADEMVAAKLIMPVKPLRLVKVIVADPKEPRRIGTDCGLAAMLKSAAGPTTRVITVVRDKGPCAPVTVTVCVPATTEEATVIVNVETAEEVEEENRTLVGVNIGVTPATEPIAVRFTIPEKPFKPVTVIVAVTEEPAWSEKEDGLPAIVKSVTKMPTGVDRVIGPLVPLPIPETVTV